MRKNDQGFNACPEWNADCCRHLFGEDCQLSHCCHRCGSSEHIVTVCDQPPPPTGSTSPPPSPLRADDMDITGDDLSDKDTRLAQAEVFALSEGERGGQKPAIEVLKTLASLPYGDDGDLKISSLAAAMEATESGTTYDDPDPILDKLGDTSPFTFNDLRPISAPSMRKEDGEYRTNQLAVVAATTASSFLKMITSRRQDCLAGLSPGYLASRVFFIKLWIFLTLEVLGISPLRKWTPEYSPVEDSVMEMFLVFCSSRFVTWGSVLAAKAHVVEFMRSMLGVVPPPFHGANYTAQKLRKPLAKERPNGRVTRTGFTVEEINAMFNVAISLMENSDTNDEVVQLVNLTMALGMTYEKGMRGGNVVPNASWNAKDHLSRQAVGGLIQSAGHRQELLAAGAVAVLVNPPTVKTSTHYSETARQTTTKPLVFDLTSEAPFSMAVLGTLVHRYDNVEGDLSGVPAFRDARGQCVTTANLRIFLRALAGRCSIDVKKRGIGLHSLRIAREAAWDAGVNSGDDGSMYATACKQAARQCHDTTVNSLTGHTSTQGRAPYNRDDIAKHLHADRAAAKAVLSPIEVLWQFTADRAQARSMVVRLLDNGAFRVVTEESELQNHAVDDDSDTDEDDDEEIAGTVSHRPTTESDPSRHDVSPTRNDAEQPVNSQNPGPVMSPAHGAMSPGQARHRHSKRSTGPSFLPPQDNHYSPASSPNAQGKRVMGSKGDDQTQRRHPQGSMLATTPAPNSPPPASKKPRELERQLIPEFHESDHTVGGTPALQDTLSGSRYQLCPGCLKHISKHLLAHHVATECEVCMTQKSEESSDEDPGDQEVTAQALDLPETDDLIDDTDVCRSPQGAVAAPTQMKAAGTSGSSSPGDTDPANSVTTNDTGARTPREAEDVDVPDTGHDDLSRHMRQPDSPATRDHSPDRPALHWRETCTQATPWSRPHTTGTIDIDMYTTKWTQIVTRALHARATTQGRVMRQSQMRSYGSRVIRDSMIAVGAQTVMDMTAITHPEADDDMDDATSIRVESALTAASRTSFCTDAYVKAAINAVALSSATIARIRDTRSAGDGRSKTSRSARGTDDSQLPACMRAEVKARGDTGAERID